MYRKVLKFLMIGVLALVWGWLGWGFLSAKGITLFNLLILAMTGIIIFVPLYKRYIRNDSPTKGQERQ
ncbi:MAG: hypothetical protein HDS79_00430 [Bacteroidales bacterium]|nr:hypothetical protein [Bacteroidales bacterium]MDE7464903.1 hypothetical protein [Muribaculaceae bacterium]